MIALAPEDVADLRRWAICAAVIVLVHGGVAAAMVKWHQPIEPDDLAAGIVVQLAPLMAAPAEQQTELPPGPEMTASAPSLNRPTDSLEEKTEEKVEQKVEAKLEQKVEEKAETKPVDELPPEVAPAPDPEVKVPPPPPRQEVQRETPKRQTPSELVPTTSALQSIAEETAAVPVAPTQGKPKLSTSNAVPTWAKQVSLLLERNIRYPELANRRGQTGVVQVSFSLDRQGHVVDSRVVRSSGVAVLDEEALALLRRAQPLPPPPAEFPGDPVTLLVPIRFHAASDGKR